MESAPPVNTDGLASFIRHLNVARQFIASYPPEHPILHAAEEKLASEGTKLVSEIGSFTLGVAKDTLYLLDQELDRSVTPFTLLARTLYERNVATITFLNGMGRGDLHALNQLLSEKPETLLARGGIAVLLSSHTDRIRIVEVDYRAFVAIDRMDEGEVKRDRLWHLFIQTLLSGSDQIAFTGESGIDFDDVERLSTLITELGSSDAVRTLIESYGRSLVTFSRNFSSQKGLSSLLERIGTLIERLPDELKRQFISSSVNSLSTHPDMLKEMLQRIDPDFLLSTLEEMTSGEGKIPSLVMSLITRFDRERSQTVPHALEVEQETTARLRELFREDDLDAFLPQSYQESLRKILSGDTVPMHPPPQELAAEIETLSPHELERKTGDIVLELIRLGGEDDTLPMLIKNFTDAIRYHVDTGDFAKGLAMLASLEREGESLPHAELLREEIARFLSSPEFVSEILNGLTLWGKTKYDDIRQFILRGGEGYVPPLLDRLAVEENMSLRRYCIDRLLELKPPVSLLLERLSDDRWYVIRNILVLLRALADPSICRHLHRLTRHPHPRVRHEAIRTLTSLGDREADRILLSLLKSDDEEQIISGLQLAEKSSNPEVFRTILALLDRGGLTSYEYRLKSAAVQTLGEIGNPAALPRLEKILFSTQLIHASQHNRLKGDIIRSLSLYPPQSVVPLFKRIASGGSKEMIALAEESYRILQRKRQGG